MLIYRRNMFVYLFGYDVTIVNFIIRYPGPNVSAFVATSAKTLVYFVISWTMLAVVLCKFSIIFRNPAVIVELETSFQHHAAFKINLCDFVKNVGLVFAAKVALYKCMWSLVR